jgi:hypothetical protein
MAAVVVSGVGTHGGVLQVAGRLDNGGVPDFRVLLAATLYQQYINRQGSPVQMVSLHRADFENAAKAAFEAADAFCREAEAHQD